jgi:NADPH:quinone reductase-like Zn-dependent oxidoreductase
VQAALVEAFGSAPRYTDVADPVPTSPYEVVVQVRAAGLHPRVLSQADGSHYTSSGELPLVPGVDGVGVDPDGRLRYFVLPDTTRGSMAEQAVVDTRRSVLLPEGSDPVAVAAAMNPAMSSWVALRRRVPFERGQNLLVLGATGNAGRMAVQIGRLLGAAAVVAVGRDAAALSALPALGATGTVQLDGTADAVDRLAHAGRDVDVVLDYLWGRPTADALQTIVPARTDDSRPLTWVQIGSVAGPTAAIPSAALRATRLQLVGSGQGSVPTRDIVAELSALAAEIAAGSVEVGARAVPLADVEAVWPTARNSRERIVLTP